MILILSSSNDFSTCEVIDWLIHLEIPFLRVNDSEPIKILSLDLASDTIIFEHKNLEYNLDQFNSFWYRRGPFNFGHKTNLKAINDEIEKKIKTFLSFEINTLSTFFYKSLSKKKCLSQFFNHHLNKLDVLKSAESVGLKIPKTKVITSKKQLIVNKDWITKSLNLGFAFFFENSSYQMYTEKVIPNQIEQNKTYFPSLVQEQIPKLFEIRSFYLDGSFYSMAIFSQANNITTVDFRRYSTKRPNRRVPYILPEPIKIKLKSLLDLYKLNTGSIDIIYSTERKYVFLEINPIGQFGMVSHPCNYHIEKKIAKFLQ